MKLRAFRAVFVVLFFAVPTLTLSRAPQMIRRASTRPSAPPAMLPMVAATPPTGKTLKVPDLRSDDVQKKTDAQLIELTTAGKGKMPAYKDKLTDAQIKGLVAYTRELAKKK